MSQPKVDVDDLTRSQQEQLDSIAYWTRKMDGQWSVLGVSVGWDAVFGLLPVVGDSLTACISLALVNKARKMHAPKRLLLRMLVNVGIDFFGGALPVLGDVFDVVWRANSKNLDLLEQYYGVEHSEKITPDKTSSLILLIALLACIAAVIYFYYPPQLSGLL